jgi:hypothetical protein
MDRRTRCGTPPWLQAEVSDMRGLCPRFARVLLPVGLPVQPRYHEALKCNSGLLEVLHLRSPTDRVDIERPAAICRVRIVQRIEPNLRHRRKHAGLPEIGKVRFAVSQFVPDVRPALNERDRAASGSPKANAIASAESARACPQSHLKISGIVMLVDRGTTVLSTEQ